MHTGGHNIRSSKIFVGKTIIIIIIAIVVAAAVAAVVVVALVVTIIVRGERNKNNKNIENKARTREKTNHLNNSPHIKNQTLRALGGLIFLTIPFSSSLLLPASSFGALSYSP